MAGTEEMRWMMEIDIQELKSIFNIVLERYVRNNGMKAEIKEDYYWHISSDDASDFSGRPKEDEMCVGSLDDDYSSLKELLADRRKVSILDLERIAYVLNAISYEIEKSGEKWI